VHVRRRAVGRDPGLTLRMVFVAALVAATVALLLYGYWLAGNLHWYLWFLLPVLVLVGAQSVPDDPIPVDKQERRVGHREEQELRATVERLAALADLPAPKTAIVRSRIPNAFTTGWGQKSSTITITTRLRDLLDDRELEAVLGHELGHLANRDATVMSLASVVQRVGAGMFHGVFLIAPLGALVYAVGTLQTVALSRYREYAADRASAVVTGAPAQLLSALRKIGAGLDGIPKADLRAAAGLNTLFIVASRRHFWFELASSHPPLEKRLRALEAISREMGRVDA
jgi:heat shock protein HtpX